MKAFLLIAALAAIAFAQGEPTYHEYVPPKYPCVWTVTVETNKLLEHFYTKYEINSWYIRSSTINHQNVLINDAVYRPDITYYNNVTNITYMTYWTYSATRGCQHDEKTIPLELYKENPLRAVMPETNLFSFVWKGENFTNKTSLKFHDIDCDVYFDIDIDSMAVYVDKSNKYVVGVVMKNDIPDQRTEYKFEYGYVAPYTDFAFDKDYVYNCTNNHIFDVPTLANATCGASTVHAVLALVLAALLVALF